jgi:hypothetical protein
LGSVPLGRITTRARGSQSVSTSEGGSWPVPAARSVTAVTGSPAASSAGAPPRSLPITSPGWRVATVSWAVRWTPCAVSSSSQQSVSDRPAARAVAASERTARAALIPSLSRTVLPTVYPSASSYPNTNLLPGAWSPPRTIHLKPVSVSA